MQQPHICEKCGTPFIRDRITQRGCSRVCSRWLYEHQDDPRPRAPVVVETDAEREARHREQRRNVMRRYRAKRRVRTQAEQIGDHAKRVAYLRVAEKECEIEQRVCAICGNTFVFDPNTGLLPGCTRLCRRLLYKQQIEAAQ